MDTGNKTNEADVFVMILITIKLQQFRFNSWKQRCKLATRVTYRSTKATPHKICQNKI